MTRQVRRTGFIARSAALALLLGATSISVNAQPRMDTLAPETIVDRGAPGYRFERIVIAGEDDQHRYRVTVGIPDGRAPACGYPALWLLDGKAALAHIDEAQLAENAGDRRPVIIAIAHDTPLRLDGPERVRDYTPGEGSKDARGRPGGGADAFLQLINERARPAVGQLVPLDPHRQALWGHSLGGLFVLHALLKQPDAFSLYFAASPSIWWDDGAMRGRLADMDWRQDVAPTQVIVGRETPPPDLGRDEGKPGTNPQDDAFLAALAQLPGIDLRYISYPGAGHGGTMSASIPDALRAVSALNETAAKACE